MATSARSRTPVRNTSRVAPDEPPLPTAGAALHLVRLHRPGLDSDALCDRLEQRCHDAGHAVCWHVARRGSSLPVVADAAAAAAKADGGVLLVAGGDGTLNTVAQAAWHHGLLLGLLPHGTFNYFGRHHGLPSQPEQALDLALQALSRGQRRPVPVGRVNGRLFLVNASLGLYPRLLREREQASRRFGRSRAVALAAGALTLLSPGHGRRFQVRSFDADGRMLLAERSVSTLFVGSNPLQLAEVGLSDAAHDVAHGSLGVVLLPPRGRLDMAQLMWQAAIGRLGDDGAVDRWACQVLELRDAEGRPGRQVAVAFDGEQTRMALPLRFERVATPLWLLAPPRAASAEVAGADPVSPPAASDQWQAAPAGLG